MNRIIECFNKKIRMFESHEKYSMLKREADKAKNFYGGYGYEAIAYTDFIERIAAMPYEYIKDWLEEKGSGLEWRECDKKMLSAIKGGFVHLLELYQNHTIHKIGSGAENFYKSCGYMIIKEGNNIFAIKEDKTNI